MSITYQSPDPLIRDILSKISFRLVTEEQSMSFNETADESRTDSYKALDVANTIISDTETKIFSIDFLQTPRFSTVAIGYIVNQLVAHMPQDQIYLNIGTWCGFSLFAGTLGNPTKKCIGIDNFSEPGNAKNIFSFQYQRFKNMYTQFFETDYMSYFSQNHKDTIGVFYYDANHLYEHQMRALHLAAPYLASGSYILIDDTSTGDPRTATLDFVREHSNSYEVVLDITTPNDRHPTFWCGLMIVKKR